MRRLRGQMQNNPNGTKQLMVFFGGDNVRRVLGETVIGHMTHPDVLLILYWSCRKTRERAWSCLDGSHKQGGQPPLRLQLSRYSIVPMIGLYLRPRQAGKPPHCPVTNPTDKSFTVWSRITAVIECDGAEWSKRWKP